MRHTLRIRHLLLLALLVGPGCTYRCYLYRTGPEAHSTRNTPLRVGIHRFSISNLENSFIAYSFYPSPIPQYVSFEADQREVEEHLTRVFTEKLLRSQHFASVETNPFDESDVDLILRGKITSFVIDSNLDYEWKIFLGSFFYAGYVLPMHRFTVKFAVTVEAWDRQGRKLGEWETTVANTDKEMWYDRVGRYTGFPIPVNSSINTAYASLIDQMIAASHLDRLEPAPSAAAGATPPAPSATKPAVGIYALQGEMDFDCLDGVVCDASAGTLSLFGHRASKDRLVRVGYLDHLATALECDSPVFSLEWTPASERAVHRAMEAQFDRASVDEITTKLSKVFDANGRLSATGTWFFAGLGAKVTEGMNRYQTNARLLEAAGRKQAGEALEAFGTWALETKRGDKKAAFQGLLGVFRALGIFDSCQEIARKYHDQEITESQMYDEMWPFVLTHLASAFGWDRAGYSNKYRALRQRGRSCEDASDEAFLDFQNDLNTLPRQLVDTLSAKVSDITVPPATMKQFLGVEPRVRPVFKQLPERSQLARVALEADVFCKSLMDMPGLRGEVPGYRTYFEWLRAKGQRPVTGEGHLWLSPDGFEIRESPAGDAMRFGRTPMRIYLERYTAGRKSTPDPQLSEYASLLTACYDEIAAKHPTLHELREAAKVVAVAQWLKKHNVRISMPKTGRAEWSPPAELPGVTYMTIAVKSGPTGAILTAAGGVDFWGNTDWKLTRGPLDLPRTILASSAPRPLACVSRQSVGGQELTVATIRVCDELTEAPADLQLQRGADQSAFILEKSVRKPTLPREGGPGSSAPSALEWETGPADRRAWSDELRRVLAPNIGVLETARDISQFAPNYSSLSPSQRLDVWASLVAAIASFESQGFKPDSKFLETKIKDGEGRTVPAFHSVGLLQLSYKEREQRAYGYEHLDEDAKSLEDPLVNLRCGVKVLTYWVRKDGVIASGSGEASRGGARYWSVLREGPGHHLRDIQRKVQEYALRAGNGQ